MDAHHGLKYGEMKVAQLFHGEERVFPRKSTGEQQWRKDAGITSSIDEIERWFHRYMRNEASFLGVYQRNTESESIIVRFKRNLPVFDGTWHTEDFMNWVDDIEDFFEEVNPPVHIMCGIILYKMKGVAYDRWKQLQYDRLLDGKDVITSWPGLRRLLISEFAPRNCSMKGLLEVHSNNNLGENDVCRMPDGLYHTTAIVTATTEFTVKQVQENDKKTEDSSENAKLDEGSADEKSKERMVVTSAKCSTKLPNQPNKQEKEKLVKHTDCSIKFPVEVYSYKHDESLGSESTEHDVEGMKEIAKDLEGNVVDKKDVDRMLLKPQAQTNHAAVFAINGIVLQDFVNYKYKDQLEVRRLVLVVRFGTTMSLMLDAPKSLMCLIYNKYFASAYLTVQYAPLLIDPGGALCPVRTRSTKRSVMNDASSLQIPTQEILSDLSISKESKVIRIKLKPECHSLEVLSNPDPLHPYEPVDVVGIYHYRPRIHASVNFDPGGKRQTKLSIGIYNAMELYKTDGCTICGLLGLVASMSAFIVAFGGKGRRLYMPNANVMFHQPLGTIGRQYLRYRRLLHSSLVDLRRRQLELGRKACVAAGQHGLVVLYDSLLSQLAMSSSQLLVTDNDVRDLDFWILSETCTGSFMTFEGLFHESEFMNEGCQTLNFDPGGDLKINNGREHRTAQMVVRFTGGAKSVTTKIRCGESGNGSRAIGFTGGTSSIIVYSQHIDCFVEVSDSTYYVATMKIATIPWPILTRGESLSCGRNISISLKRLSSKPQNYILFSVIVIRWNSHFMDFKGCKSNCQFMCRWAGPLLGASCDLFRRLTCILLRFTVTGSGADSPMWRFLPSRLVLLLEELTNDTLKSLQSHVIQKFLQLLRLSEGNKTKMEDNLDGFIAIGKQELLHLVDYNEWMICGVNVQEHGIAWDEDYVKNIKFVDICWTQIKKVGAVLFLFYPEEICIFIFSGHSDYELNLTRERDIPLEGWNDANNANTKKKFIMVELISDLCIKILCKNGQFMETLRLFYKVVNGLDPPMDLDSDCEASMWILTNSLVDELLRRRDGMM